MVVKLAATGTAPFEIQILGESKKKGHGTKISAVLEKHRLDADELRQLIGSKFLVDPSLCIKVNRQSVHFSHRGWLWTILKHEGVDPINNAAERSLRHAVIWRKRSFGTRRVKGSRFVETLLTVIETGRQQSRNVVQFLTTAVKALFANQSAPSLLSGP